MKLIHAVRLSACALALVCATNAFGQTATPNVMLSMNVFPTNLANPNGGGTFTIVAKTDSTQGISAVNAYLNGVSTIGLDVENDIGHDLADPWFLVLSGGVVNLLYGQDLTSAPLVGGVGTVVTSDGPDPLGNPLWNDATRIFSGIYNSSVPSFATNVGTANHETDANTFAQVVVGVAAIDANTTTFVRVAVPESATMGLAATAMAVAVGVGRRRRQQ